MAEKSGSKRAETSKQVAFVLPKDEARNSDDAQHFGVFPGLYVPGEPVLLSELDPQLSAADARRLIDEHNLPLQEVKLAADRKPKKGFSQVELRNRGEATHLPSGPPAVDFAREGVKPKQYRQHSVEELREAARIRGVEEPDELDKNELIEKLNLLDAEAAAPTGSSEGVSAGGPGVTSGNVGVDASAGGRA